MKNDARTADKGANLRRARMVWLSSLVFGRDTVVSRTEMVRHLSELDEEIRLFAISSQKNAREKPDKRFIFFPMRFVPTITQLMYILALLLYVPLYIVVKNPDFIITDKGTAIVGFVMKLLFPKAKFKVILDIRTTPLKGPRIDSKGNLQEKWNLLSFSLSLTLAKKKFDGITIITELMKKEVCYRFNIDPRIVAVWTSGVSAALFDPRSFDKEEFRRSLGLKDEFVIFYHGTLRPGGLVETFNAIKLLKTTRHDLTLFLLGSRPEISAFWRNLAQDLDVQNNVIFHGSVPYSEVPKYIAVCDVAIVPLPDSPNWRHQCPLKLLEYLAMEKVTIITDIPANREVIGNDKCGIYISSVDPKEIAEAIAYAYGNRESLSEWGASGRTIVEDKYSWETIAEGFRDYLRHL